ncbi:MAG TPA: crosslink repair DNA glycosylase YcaQ family protein [Mycobacteriales bacterium]|nr:crosslink repair DNA glycosylase YcaQ family protein [Mycobacteriales bacterium]
MSPRSLSVDQARRLAIVAQGLTGTRPSVAPDRRHLRRVLRHTGQLQIDSVNVLARAHYLPAYSRLGPYDATLVDRTAFTHRELFEYWGHEAALLPVELHPLMRWRMSYWENRLDNWGRLAKLTAERPHYVEWVYDEVVARGPVSAGEVAEDRKRGTDQWGWNWTDAKTALEYLFYVGRITTATRRNFERLYDVPERVLPPGILALPTPDAHEAQRELLMIAARCHGVGTLGDLADYYRLRNPQARPRLAELVEDGRLEQVEVRGWALPAYAVPEVIIPRRMAGRALLVPFDPLIWERERTERLFGFRYRIEIYVPAAKRVHGYYVLPFLLGDSLVARVDLKADRALRVLRVRSSWAEPKAPAETAAELAAELALMANWLGLDDIVVEPRGDLAPALAAAVVR